MPLRQRIIDNMQWLNSWESFVKTVETGSMAAAARRLDCTRAQISKQIADLERAFGVRLFERSTRKLSLTPSGEIFHQHALRALDAIHSTEVAVRNMGEAPYGVLRISASITFGRLYIAPLLPKIVAKYPDLNCELVLTDHLVQAIERTADGFHAKVVQHECDHLVGILFPQRVRDFTKFGFNSVLFPNLAPENDD